jgi:hypothetical protein
LLSYCFQGKLATHTQPLEAGHVSSNGYIMTWTESFSCNVCGKRKGEVDHWWLAWVDQIQPSDEEEFKPKLQIMPWSELMARSIEVVHLCGAGCALKEAERWMTSVAQTKRAASSAAD